MTRIVVSSFISPHVEMSEKDCENEQAYREARDFIFDQFINAWCVKNSASRYFRNRRRTIFTDSVRATEDDNSNGAIFDIVVEL